MNPLGPPLLYPRQRSYHTFRLKADVDWTSPAVQQAWAEYARLSGHFLSVETPLTLDELLVLCQAYARQHGNPTPRPVAFFTLEYDLQALVEHGIVDVDEWRPLVSRWSTREGDSL
jgi:hypothetical protein